MGLCFFGRGSGFFRVLWFFRVVMVSRGVSEVSVFSGFREVSCAFLLLQMFREVVFGFLEVGFRVAIFWVLMFSGFGPRTRLTFLGRRGSTQFLSIERRSSNHTATITPSCRIVVAGAPSFSRPPLLPTSPNHLPPRLMHHRCEIMYHHSTDSPCHFQTKNVISSFAGGRFSISCIQ